MTERESRFTRRLRLEPAGPARARDLWLVHGDDGVWPWYGGEKPSLEQVERQAVFMGDSWRRHGVHKWIAYDRVSGEVVGRGGLSRTPVDDDWGQLRQFLPDEPWVRAAHDSRRPFTAHAHWLEIGWALRREHWGRGYASEIGRAGLDYAFGVLGARAVVSCTVRHNTRSRAVMERIGLRYAGEIRSRGVVEGVDGERDDAPYAVCVLLRRDWAGPDRLAAGATALEHEPGHGGGGRQQQPRREQEVRDGADDGHDHDDGDSGEDKSDDLHASRVPAAMAAANRERPPFAPGVIPRAGQGATPTRDPAARLSSPLNPGKSGDRRHMPDGECPGTRLGTP
ncbi:MAG TPA: GNAT family N-acetyltransferase [Trebonia sp.]|jgi:RimJ/RimL family protein N-acetyltransferase